MLRVLATLLLFATPAVAQDYVTFQTPSGNIQCLAWDSGGENFVDCELRQMATSPLQRRPAGCELDWGRRFAVAATGPAEMVCAGDTVQDPDGLVLPYGQTATFGAVRCTSREAGLECRNAEGHGFLLSRARQELF